MRRRGGHASSPLQCAGLLYHQCIISSFCGGGTLCGRERLHGGFRVLVAFNHFRLVSTLVVALYASPDVRASKYGFALGEVGKERLACLAPFAGDD